MDADCPLCRLLRTAEDGRYPYVVADLGSSVLFMGDDRDGDLYRGYAILALKEHVREPHELSPPAARAHFEELMIAGRAVDEAFGPAKVNYASFGNEVPHLHWHIIPRYRHDRDFGCQPWKHEARFMDGMIAPDDGSRLAGMVRACLPGVVVGDADG